MTDFSYVVLGKGETAGGPTAKGLRRLGIEPQIIDSKTPNPDEIIRNADIVISCVGKGQVVNSTNIKNGTILIGVGTRGEDGKIKGDYIKKDVENIVSAYTPTPGGVGPVNLSFLFQNLIEAAESTLDNN
jgi:methylenetetrahydrofolate dehydrogenase (NADP+)/methenyltetrahydrofolate cyclohydrolase